MSSPIDAQKAQSYIDYFNDTVGANNPGVFYSQWVDKASLMQVLQDHPEADGFQLFYARYKPNASDTNPNFEAGEATIVIAPTKTNAAGVRINITTALLDYNDACKGCPNNKVYPPSIPASEAGE